jgi:RecA-family ATPase
MEIIVKEIAPEARRRGMTIPLAEYEKYRVKPTESLEEPKFMFQYGGVKFMPQGDIQAVKAKAKSGKTLFMAILAASALGCETFGIKKLGKRNSVLYIDTEQNKRSTNIFLKRVYDLLGWNTDEDHKKEFNAYSLREMEGTDDDPTATTQRREAVISLITQIEPKPTLAIIDGIADITKDFNDIESSGETISELMRVAQKMDVAIINILHTNKGYEDHNMKGHLGTLLLQKASDVFELRKHKEDSFEVVHTDSRNAKVNNLNFKVTPNNEDITLTPIEKINENDNNETNYKQNFNEAFTHINAQETTYTTLLNTYQQLFQKKDSATKKHIAKAIQLNIIKKNKNNTYSLC